MTFAAGFCLGVLATFGAIFALAVLFAWSEPEEWE